MFFFKLKIENHFFKNQNLTFFGEKMISQILIWNEKVKKSAYVTGKHLGAKLRGFCPVCNINL